MSLLLQFSQPASSTSTSSQRPGSLGKHVIFTNTKPAIYGRSVSEGRGEALADVAEILGPGVEAAKSFTFGQNGTDSRDLVALEETLHHPLLVSPLKRATLQGPLLPPHKALKHHTAPQEAVEEVGTSHELLALLASSLETLVHKNEQDEAAVSNSSRGL